MTDQPSYTSHYDHSVVYRQALEYLQAHHPNISYSQATEIAYVVMKLISDQQIQPLLSSLASINQTLDALNVPPVERTATQPDDIDRMHERIKWLLDNPAPAANLETVNALLDQLLPNDSVQEQAEPFEQRLARIGNELSRWREAVKSGTATIPLPMATSSQTTLSLTKVMVVQEVMGHLAETKVLPIPYELASRLDSMKQESAQLGDRLAACLDHVQVLSDQMLKSARSHQGWSKKLKADIEANARTLAGLEVIVRQHQRDSSDSRGQTTDEIRRLAKVVNALQTGLDSLREAMVSPGKTSERLIREALDTTGAQEALQQLEQALPTTVKPVVPDPFYGLSDTYQFLELSRKMPRFDVFLFTRGKEIYLKNHSHEQNEGYSTKWLSEDENILAHQDWCIWAQVILALKDPARVAAINAEMQYLTNNHWDLWEACRLYIRDNPVSLVFDSDDHRYSPGVTFTKDLRHEGYLEFKIRMIRWCHLRLNAHNL